MMRIFQLKCFHWEEERRRRRGKKKETKIFMIPGSLKFYCFGCRQGIIFLVEGKEEIAMQMLMVF